MRSLLLGQLNGSQCISGFTRLRNGNDHVVWTDDGIAVTEFRSVLHFNRDAGKILKQVFSHQSRMPAGAASYDQDALCGLPFFPVVVDAGHFDFRPGHAHAAADGIQDGIRLLKNFLEHEVVEAALFDGFNLHFELVNLRRDHRVLEVANRQAVLAVHDRDLFVVQVDHVLRVLDDGRRIGSDVKLILFTYSNDEGAGFACSDEQIGLVGVNDGDGVSAFHFLEGHLHGVGDGGV